jgi:hypothetical protein|eukprot:COSAG02_NODE_279_length_25809_cov_21.674173_12_plen_70_part_00
MAARVHGYANGTDMLLAFSPKTPSGDGRLHEDHKFSSGDSITVCRGNPQVSSRGVCDVLCQLARRQLDV